MDTWRERLHEDIPGACHVVHRYESGRLRKRSELTIAFSGESATFPRTEARDGVGEAERHGT